MAFHTVHIIEGSISYKKNKTSKGVSKAGMKKFSKNFKGDLNKIKTKKYVPTERELNAIRLIARLQRTGAKDVSCAVLAEGLDMEYQNCIDLLSRLCMRRFIKMEKERNNYSKGKNNYSLDAMAFEYESLTREKK